MMTKTAVFGRIITGRGIPVQKRGRKVKVKDFDTFCCMIDCSRNGVPNIRSLKDFALTLSEMGYDSLMLYTEDTYTVAGEPYFGYMRGRYRPEEIRELDAYCASLGIELIPCIQTLAHLGSIFRWSDYAKINDCDDILMIDDDRTYELIDNMIRSVSGMFSSRRLHIGMDEAYYVGLGKYHMRHGETDRYEILLRHLNRVNGIAKKYGMTAMMWDDMFFRIAYGASRVVDRKVEFPDSVRELIPDGVGMVTWDYYSEMQSAYENELGSAAGLTENSWFAGGVWVWGGLTPKNRMSIRRNRMAVDACRKTGVRRFMVTLWGDDGAECPYTAALPGLMDAASYAAGMSEDEMKERFREITGADYDMFLDLDLPNLIYGEDPDAPGKGTAFSKICLYDDCFCGIALPSYKDAGPDICREYAARLADDAESAGKYAYLFECASSLCAVLAAKIGLCRRTRELYAAGDRKGLADLALSGYGRCSEAVADFYSAFRKQWMTVNKSFGFDVQDARLGGLRQRIDSCAEALRDYASGSIGAIDELEEEILPVKGGMGRWQTLISASVI